MRGNRQMNDRMDGAASILIIEDEEGLVISLEDRLAVEGYTVAAESDGIRGEEFARDGAWDLIILDVMLPGRDGFQVCQNLRKQGISTPILMLTARDTNLDTVMGLRLGADDYLCKPFDMQVLVARIAALLRRSRGTAAAPAETGAGNVTAEETPLSVMRFGFFTLDTLRKELRRRTAPKKEETVSLIAQEYRLLEYFLCHPDRVISRDELLDKVWGYGSVASTRTVDVHVARLRKKLGEESVPRHIHTARGHGYRFSIEDMSKPER